MKQTASAYSVASVLQPTIVLPLQFWDRNKSAHLPEMRLVAAVLESAVDCITRHASAPRGKRWREFRDACRWVLSEKRDWPFAFVNVCDFLGLEATAVRESLRPYIATHRRQPGDFAAPAAS